MSAADGVMLAVKSSLALTVFGIGIESTPSDTMYLLRRRALFARSIISMNVIMPLLALWLATTFGLLQPVKIALVALAISPVPPLLPFKAAKAGGNGSYTIGLLVAASVLSIVFVPATAWMFGVFFATPFHVPSVGIAKIVGTSVLIPLMLGIFSRRIAPHAAARASRPMTIIAAIALIASMIPILITAWPAFRSLIGNGTLVAIVAMTVVGLIVGHALGGPVRDHRTVLGLATASRHPAVAIAITSAILPGEKLVGAAVLLNLLVGAIASAPYIMWSKRVFHADVTARSKSKQAEYDATNRGARRIHLGHIPERRK
jgi:bile acid:Na+ symporter, BASS family